MLKPEEFEGVFHDAITRRAQGLMLGGGGFLSAHRKRIVELAAKNRLAGIYPNFQYVDAGGLMAYAEDRTYMFRRAAEYVDKVLKGTKPADLPVERPKKIRPSDQSQCGQTARPKFHSPCSTGRIR